MEKEIIVAIIGAIAVIIAALIGVWGKNEKATKVNQTSFGRNNTQIGVQLNKKASDSNDRTQ